MKTRVFSVITSLIMVISMATILPVMTAGAEVSGDYEYVVLDDGTAELLEYLGADENIIIPNYFDGYCVTKIGQNAFNNCQSIKTLFIQAYYLESIGDNAFDNCDNINDVYYQGNSSMWDFIDVGENNDVLFNNAHYMEYPYTYAIDYANNYNTYYTSGNYKYRVLNNGTAEIVEYLGNENIIVIPSELDGLIVTVIGSRLNQVHKTSGEPIVGESMSYVIGAFEGCEAETIVIPDTVNTIDNSAFCNCPNLSELQLSNNLKLIAYHSIAFCPKLTQLTLPEGLIVIDESGITNNTNLKSLSIPESVKRLYDYSIGWQDYNYYKKEKDFLIKCYPGSVAEQYAKDNGFAYELLDEQSIQTAELKYQLRYNDDGTTDFRAILVSDEQAVLDADSASVYATIADYGDTDSTTLKRAYRSFIANGKKIVADEGKVFVIGKILGIPDDMVDGMTIHFTLGENTYERTI